MITYLQFKALSSSNDYLKKHYKDLEHFTVVHVDHQTQGKGRMGRIWYDDEDSALFSILIKKAPNIDQITDLTLLTAISLHKYLKSLGLEVQIKYPNDIMHQHLKLAGILLESIILEQEVKAVIIGIGINVNQKQLMDTIKEVATSIHLITDELYDIANFIKSFVNLFYNDYHEYLKTQFYDQAYLNQYLIK